MDDLPIDRRVTIPARDLTWSAGPSSGPGGQNVNRVQTRVELRFDLAGTAALGRQAKVRLRRLAGSRLDGEGRIVITSQATRHQRRNLEDARARLAELVRRALVTPKPRKPSKPSRRAKQRRLEAKRHRSRIKKGRGRVDPDG